MALPLGDSSVGGEFVEQFVLASFELGDRIDDMFTVATHRIGMLASIVGVMSSARRLGHERPDCLVVGVAGEDVELLVDLSQLDTQRLQPCRVLC